MYFSTVVSNAFRILAATGYDASAAAQTEATRNWIRVATGIVPCILYALAFVALSRFGLDEAAHSEAVAQTTARTD